MNGAVVTRSRPSNCGGDGTDPQQPELNIGGRLEENLTQQSVCVCGAALPTAVTHVTGIRAGSRAFFPPNLTLTLVFSAVSEC